MKSRRRYGLRDALFLLYAALCLGAMVWPGYSWFGNRIEPYVLGLPFSLFWNILWVLLSLLALTLYQASGKHQA